MGFLDSLKQKKEELDKEKKSAVPEGKYSEVCAICGGAGTDTKWMGQYFHKKCKRQAKKAARKMI